MGSLNDSGVTVKECARYIGLKSSSNLVPRVRVTLDQRSGTRDSGIKRVGSHFHWLKSEHEQLDRK